MNQASSGWGSTWLTSTSIDAEGRGRAGQARRNHYEIALGSAAEACAALDLVDVPGGPEQQQLLRRAGAMLKRLGG